MPVNPSGYWLVEQGLGEERAGRIVDGRIVEARLRVEDNGPHAGDIIPAKLVRVLAGGRNGLAQSDGGALLFVSGLTGQISEGQSALLRVTRAPMRERGAGLMRQKAARAVIAEPGTQPIAFDLAGQLRFGEATPIEVRMSVPGSPQSLRSLGWEELIEEAEGLIAFDGGSLGLFPTPAMTLIDIDWNGTGGAQSDAMPGLCLKAVPAIADVLLRLDIGGPIAVDFPSLERKADRQAVDTALNDALAGLRCEKTAMNGFGLVQIIRRRARASLLDIRADAPRLWALRALLRSAEVDQGHGPLMLALPPALMPLWQARAHWHTALEKRLGRPVQAEPAGA